MHYICAVFFIGYEQEHRTDTSEKKSVYTYASTTATVTHGQVSPSEQFFLELQKKLSDYYINFQTNIQMKNCFL